MTKESITFKINPRLAIILETSDEELKRFFKTKYEGLFRGDKNKDEQSVIHLIEVEKLEIPNPQILREITIPEICVFDKNDFLVVRDKKKIRLPFSKMGRNRRLKIYFERGFPKDWIRRFLDQTLTFHAVGMKGSLFHGASLIKDDIEIIIPAWRGTGKTNLALHLLIEKGFLCKGEDQFFIFNDRSSFVYTDSCHVDYKHMSQFPSLKQKYSSLTFFLRANIVKITLPLIPSIGIISEFIRRGLLKLLAPKVFVKMNEFVPNFEVSHKQPKKRLVLQLISCPSINEISVQSIKLNQMINRCVGGMQYEREAFYPMYFAWVYATGERNPIIDNVFEKEKEILKNALLGTNCYELLTPYGYDWTKNYDKIEKLIKSVE